MISRSIDVCFLQGLWGCLFVTQIFNVQRRGVCEDKDMPCESDEAGEKCSDALQRWLHEGSLRYLRVVCCISMPGLPFAGGWQVLGLVNFSQLLDSGSSFFLGPSTSPVSGAQRKVFASNLPGVRWRRWMDLNLLEGCWCRCVSTGARH